MQALKELSILETKQQLQIQIKIQIWDCSSPLYTQHPTLLRQQDITINMRLYHSYRACVAL